MSGLYYEDFEVGETIRHDTRRTISEADNQRFCDLTMNRQPLHLDAAYAAETQFGERVVNGLLTTSLAVGLSIPDTTDRTIVANLAYDDVEHPQPVFHGDTLRAQTTVLDKRETSDGERGVVTLGVEAFVSNPRTGGDRSGDTDSDRSGDGRGGHTVAPNADRHPDAVRGRETTDHGEVLVCELERTVLVETQASQRD